VRLSIRFKILAAFVIDILLMVALGAFAAQQMRIMNERAVFVESQVIPSMASVANINSVINRYKILQLEYLIYSNDADKGRAEFWMRELESEMSGYFATYRELISNEDERNRFTQVEAAWDAVVIANHERFIPSASMVNSGSVQPFYSRMNPLYNNLDVAMQQLSDESQSQAAAALDVVRSAYTSARTFIMTDTGVAIVLSSLIALVLSGRIARRIGGLTSATREVAAGNLERRVEVRSSDELGVLASNFNQMVDSLRTQRQTLEQRNDELQTSLKRQAQLTADLVRRKQAEEAAYRAQSAAESANQAKSMFLATMSHELRTPLNAMLGYAQLLHLTSGQRGDPPEVIDQLERILGAGRHLTTLINNVLDFSKIEQGKIDLTISEFNVCSLVREIADVADPLVRRRDNTLHVDCDSRVGSMQSDTTKVRQVLLNLVGNAAKFTEHGTISLRVVYEAQNGRHDGDWVTFSVCDTGIGIAEEHLDRLFQPFSQIDSSANRQYEGTGLGLALSRQLCRALGGDITVRSVLGQGSIFSVRLPVICKQVSVAGDDPLPPPTESTPVGSQDWNGGFRS
jgi:signal transduction histidine kinase